ncbi:MAG: hypothetical protein RLZZ156_1984 [Deinococcota bacterium]|jgi:hypothetical protein
MIEQALREAGIQLEDIETRLDGQGGKALIITARELVYFENSRLQRGRLREIVNVKTAKTGELSVKSPSENLIDGNIKGFDLAELKFFFENVKSAIARAKSSATGTDFPAPKALSQEPIPVAAPPVSPAPSAPPAPTWDSTPPPANSWDAAPANSWDAAPANSWDAAPANSWDNAPVTAPNTWEKQTFEVGPDVITQKPEKDSWADLESELNPTKSGSTPGFLNASAMIPPPSPVFPNPASAKPPIDPFADLAKNAVGRSNSGDDWGNPSAAPINLKPDNNQTAVMVPSSASGEWSGEIMDASTALDSKPQKSNKGQLVRLGDQAAGIEGIARWLRILSVIYLFVGSVLPASLLIESEFSPNLSQWALIIVTFFGGLLLPLIGWGVSELLTSWAKSAGDLRSIRKATLGH